MLGVCSACRHAPTTPMGPRSPLCPPAHSGSGPASRGHPLSARRHPLVAKSTEGLPSFGGQGHPEGESVFLLEALQRVLKLGALRGLPVEMFPFRDKRTNAGAGYILRRARYRMKTETLLSIKVWILLSLEISLNLPRCFSFAWCYLFHIIPSEEI